MIEAQALGCTCGYLCFAESSDAAYTMHLEHYYSFRELHPEDHKLTHEMAVSLPIEDFEHCRFEFAALGAVQRRKQFKGYGNLVVEDGLEAVRGIKNAFVITLGAVIVALMVWGAWRAF